MKAGSHEVKITGITPHDSRTLTVHDTGEYWIQADLKIGNNTDHAYQTLKINHITESVDLEEILRIPTKQIVIIFSILIIVVIAGLAIRQR